MISGEDPEERINRSRNRNFRNLKSVSEVAEEVVASQPGKKKRIASERLLPLVILKSSPIVILAISCVIAVFVDPLFFYLPIIDEKNKCIGMDTKLRNVVLILRSLTDIGFIGHSIHKIYEGVRKTRKDLDNDLPKTKGKPNRDERSKFAKALARKLSWHSIVIDFFAVLPIPQVLGAFWYYFSIQQETTCWYRACKKHSTRGCMFYCNENMTSRNTTFINSIDEFCLVDVPTNETTSFDFGIFLDSLKNGNTGSIHFAKKFFYSFWWGLRNLSNFGTNLQTSTYVWENCFAILISVIGLVLFLVLIGKVQTFISMKTEKSEERMKTLSLKEIEAQLWMKRNNLNTELNNEIKENIKRLKWEEIKDANMDNLFSIFSMQPLETQKSLKYFLCMQTLIKVPKLENLKSKALTLIIAYLKPVVFQDSIIFQIGVPLDRILFITEGLIWTYEAAATSNTNRCNSQDGKEKTGFSFLHKGGFYGDDQLLSWAIASQKNDLCFDNLPISNANVKCHGKVEGFVLMAKDLKTVVSHKHWGFHDSGEREKAARQTILRAFHLFKYRQSKRSLREGALQIR